MRTHPGDYPESLRPCLMAALAPLGPCRAAIAALAESYITAEPDEKPAVAAAMVAMATLLPQGILGAAVSVEFGQGNLTVSTTVMKVMVQVVGPPPYAGPNTKTAVFVEFLDGVDEQFVDPMNRELEEWGRGRPAVLTPEGELHPPGWEFSKDPAEE